MASGINSLHAGQPKALGKCPPARQWPLQPARLGQKIADIPQFADGCLEISGRDVRAGRDRRTEHQSGRGIAQIIGVKRLHFVAQGQFGRERLPQGISDRLPAPRPGLRFPVQAVLAAPDRRSIRLRFDDEREIVERNHQVELAPDFEVGDDDRGQIEVIELTDHFSQDHLIRAMLDQVANEDFNLAQFRCLNGIILHSLQCLLVELDAT